MPGPTVKKKGLSTPITKSHQVTVVHDGGEESFNLNIWHSSQKVGEATSNYQW